MELTQNFKYFKIWVKAIHISLCSFLFLYSIGVFNPCQLNVAGTLNWGSNTAAYINLFSTLLAVGQFLGCMMTGKLIDHYGRRKTLIIVNTIFIFGSIILVMPETVCFGIGRVLVGVSTGIGAALGPIYLGESTPIEMIPKVGPIIYAFGGAGMITAYAFGLMLPVDNFETDPNSHLWIFMFLFPVLVAGYQLLYFIFFVKYDTPQFYLSKKNSCIAERALKETHGEQSISHGLRRVNSEIEGKSVNGIKLSFIDMIRNKKFTKMIRVGVMFAAIQQLCGITAIFFYSTDTFYRLGGGLFLARVLTLIIGIVYCCSCLFGVWLLKIFGRKTLLIFGQASVSVILLLMAVFSGYIKADPLIAAIFLILYFVPSGCAIVSTGWLYATEVLNDQIFSFASSLSFGFGIIIAFLFPISVQYIKISNTFLIFSVCMGICCLYSIIDFIETKDKDKETILIEMGVIDSRVIPRVVENNSLQSPEDFEVEENSDKNELDEYEKRLGLNSTGFNDSGLSIKEKTHN